MENMSVWPAELFKNTKHPLVLSSSSCMRSNARPSLRIQTDLSRFASQHKHMPNGCKLCLIFIGLKLVVRLSSMTTRTYFASDAVQRVLVECILYSLLLFPFLSCALSFNINNINQQKSREELEHIITHYGSLCCLLAYVYFTVTQYIYKCKLGNKLG